MCISPLCSGSQTKVENEETSSSVGFSGTPGPIVSHKSEPDSIEANSAPVEEESFDHDEFVVFETSVVPVVEVEMAQLPSFFHPSCKALDVIQEEEGSHPRVSECCGRIAGSSPASYFRSDGPQVIRCFQVASRLPRSDADFVFAGPLYDSIAVTLPHSFAAPLKK